VVVETSVEDMGFMMTLTVLTVNVL
jgi:hypothetical protein